jgi:SAM-dependent methyltransferase
MLAARKPQLLVRAAPLAQALGQGGWLGLVADEEALPFAPESFDLIVSGLALQHVNDLPGALTQIRRALRPDGLFMACIVGGQSLTELRAALAAAEEEILEGVSPRVAPFVDLRDLGGLLQRAGFALPVTDVDTVKVRYDHLFALAHDLRAMGATNALTLRDPRGLSRTVLLRAAEIYAERFSDADGRVRATFDLVWMSGWAPHESQQKPLAPGSAKVRLADALRADEQKFDD